MNTANVSSQAAASIFIFLVMTFKKQFRFWMMVSLWVFFFCGSCSLCPKTSPPVPNYKDPACLLSKLHSPGVLWSISRQLWWRTPLLLALWRQRQAGLSEWPGQSGLHGKYQASQGDIVRLYLNNKDNKENKIKFRNLGWSRALFEGRVLVYHVPLS